MFSANENLALRQHKRRVVQFVEDCIPDFALDAVPFPITKAVFEVLNKDALFVTEEPEELYCPITTEA